MSDPALPEDHRGLVVPVGKSDTRLVMAGQEICDDLFATIPKLKAAATSGTSGKSWKVRKVKENVELYEYSPWSGGNQSDDPEIVHALVAKTELRCHLNEVLNVLINPDSSDFNTTMKSLCGKKFESGKVLFKQHHKLRFPGRVSKPRPGRQIANLPQEGLVTVQITAFRPKMSVRLSAARKTSQKLAFSSCTLQYASKDRAVHVMKTLPRAVHDQVVRQDFTNDDHSALHDGVDHISVGIDIKSTHGAYSARAHSTQIFMYTYASAVAPAEYTNRLTPHHKLKASDDPVHHHKPVINTEARHVMEILTKSLRQYETVIRRRRFGFQSFVYFSTIETPTTAPKQCQVCRKKFRFYRRDGFCTLCGHIVCSDCSRNHEVEPRIGDVRKTRCCIDCIIRVDNCVFDDEDLVAALGPAVVDVDANTWNEDYPSVEDILRCDSLLSMRQQDAASQSPELEKLVQLVQPSRPVRRAKLHTTQVLQEVDAHVRASVQNARELFPIDKCEVYGREHDYAYSFGDNTTAPLAPRPAAQKETRRLHHIAASGVLKPDYDSTALDMLAQLAAKHLKCEIGYVSVIDAKEQRVVGAYNYPQASVVVPRGETLCMHGVYAEKPMVLKNPRRDQRFAQLPVVKDHGLQFYAGFPIRAPDGTVVASLCTGDTTSHANISTKDYATMKVLADLASELLVPRR
jgi:hypothetical protein